ncbi:MAG: archaemetzincin family Zn-dependent metalloprotease [Deltaproteobacteria bacterium]|nr:archaemetzincin family Zn-dependent metalloprotease [Deltaproteobacteria bacterium]
MDPGILQWLRKEMADCLFATVRAMPQVPVPPESYDAGRNQYYSTKILKEMLKEVPEDAFKILGVTDKDLCIPILTYVFGEAQLGGTAAVVSLARLRQEHYGAAPDRPLLLSRLRKESLHELGHTFGLIHCPSRDCVMYLSNTVAEVDGKGRTFCRACMTVVTSQTGAGRE